MYDIRSVDGAGMHATAAKIVRCARESLSARVILVNIILFLINRLRTGPTYTVRCVTWMLNRKETMLVVKTKRKMTWVGDN